MLKDKALKHMSVLGTFLMKKFSGLISGLWTWAKFTKQEEQDVRKECLEQEHSLRNCIKTFDTLFGHRV